LASNVTPFFGQSQQCASNVKIGLHGLRIINNFRILGPFRFFSLWLYRRFQISQISECITIYDSSEIKLRAPRHSILNSNRRNFNNNGAWIAVNR